MPLYMDFHKFESVTIEAVKTAHIADIGIQDKYGVKYHQFWVNEEEGSVFCLVEAPDKDTCELVHQLAHGNVACALTEVEAGLYEKLMGKEHQIDHGHVKHADGTVDPGYRNIIVASVYGITNATSSKDFSCLLTPLWAREIIVKTISSFKGRELEWGTDDSLTGIFNDATHALQCSLQIQHQLLQNRQQPEIIFKLGISASQPVTNEGDFFNKAIRLAHYLNLSARNNQILISSLVNKLCKEPQLLSNTACLKSLSIKDEEFITNIIRIAEANIADQQFDLNRLSNEICVSRPQLYRKVMSVTGRSPHDFIHDLRMNKALFLLKENKAGIAEIAYETGFSSPSYFTRCFSQKFGCTPSALSKTNPS